MGEMSLKPIYKPKKWICHCNLEIFDGKDNIKSKPTEIVFGKTQFKAIAKVKDVFKERYERLG
jgi:hypothetical protein